MMIIGLACDSGAGAQEPYPHPTGMPQTPRGALGRYPPLRRSVWRAGRKEDRKNSKGKNIHLLRSGKIKEGERSWLNQSDCERKKPNEELSHFTNDVIVTLAVSEQLESSY